MYKDHVFEVLVLDTSITFWEDDLWNVKDGLSIHAVTYKEIELHRVNA